MEYGKLDYYCIGKSARPFPVDNIWKKEGEDSRMKLTVLVCDRVSWRGVRIVCFGKYGKRAMPRNRERSRDRRPDAVWIQCSCARMCTSPPIVGCAFRRRCLRLAIWRKPYGIRDKRVLASNRERYGIPSPRFDSQHRCIRWMGLDHRCGVEEQRIVWSVKMCESYSNGASSTYYL